jgi:ATP synthase A1 C subunit
MSVWRYKRLTPKVLVSRHQLIPTEGMIDLIGRPLEYIQSSLARTSYQREVSEISPQDMTAISLEDALVRNFARTVDEVAQCAPKEIQALLKSTLMKFEASNAKSVLRAKSAGLSSDQVKRCILPAGAIDLVKWKEIIDGSKDVRDVVKLLSNSELGSTLEEKLDEYEKTEVLFPLEAELDRYVYGEIWKKARDIGGVDGRIAKTILGLEMDSINIRIILRCKEAGMQGDWLKEYIVPASDVFDEKELKNAVDAVDVGSSIKCLLEAAKRKSATDYQRLLTELAEDYNSHKSLSHLEALLDRGLLKVSLRMVKRYTSFFNIGAVLALLNSKWFELRNLRTIIGGVGVPPSKVKELLILPT